ncbi:MAG: N-acetylmuramoyl-L-alanine amidase-like domain-containing protein, partial [Thermodesulfobacteriota bacterium]
TDWPVFNKDHVRDVTKKIGGEKTNAEEKVLNKKEDGTYFLPGIPVKERKIEYIPSSAVDDVVIYGLRTGDYIGIYSDIQGLDVSHTGIFIKKGDKIFLRHASSREKNRKVVDEDFKDYIANKPGIIVFRPK